MISKAEEDHLPKILEIERLVFDQPWFLYHFRNDILNSRAQNFIYKTDSTLTGYIFGWIILDHPENQKVKRMYLEVNASNLPARNLYEKFNFNPYGERKDYYTKGDSAILYNLDL